MPKFRFTKIISKKFLWHENCNYICVMKFYSSYLLLSLPLKTEDWYVLIIYLSNPRMQDSGGFLFYASIAQLAVASDLGSEMVSVRIRVEALHVEVA